MGAKVSDKIRAAANLEDIKNAALVRSETWTDLANTQNTVLGRGAQLICDARVNCNIPVNQERTLEVTIAPRIQAAELEWIVWGTATRFDGTSTQASSLLQMQVDSGPQKLAHFGDGNTPGWGAVSERMRYRETLASHSEAVRQVTLTFNTLNESDAPVGEGSAAPGNTLITHIACYELPRGRLNTDSGNDAGVDPSEFQVADRIFSEAGEGGVITLAQGVTGAYSIGRRACHFAWFGDENQPLQTRATAGEDLFPIDIPMHTRRVRGETRDVEVHVYASGSSGSVDITTENDSVSIPVETGTYAWFSGTVAVLSDDYSEATGLKGADFDFMNIQGTEANGDLLSIRSIVVLGT